MYRETTNIDRETVTYWKKKKKERKKERKID